MNPVKAVLFDYGMVLSASPDPPLWIESFDHHTWSHPLTLLNPDPAIYLPAAEGLRTPPANILFIDDRPENIEAALAVGMQAIHYTTHAAFEQDMHARGLDSLLQLVP